MKELLIDLYNKNSELINNGSPLFVKELREKALEVFKQNGLPNTKTENWRQSDIQSRLEHEFAFNFVNQSKSLDVVDIFTCDVYDLDTFSVTMLNGWFVYQNAPITQLPDGTIIGSLSKAMEVYPEIIEKYLGKAADINKTGVTALNTAFMQDGLFVHVPDNVEVEKPIQIINIVDLKENTFLQPRHLIVVGKNSKLTVVHCDHSLVHNISFSNTVAEIFLEENSKYEHYKVQNMGKNSSLLTNLFIKQKEGSSLVTNALTLNGAFTKNYVDVGINGKNCNSELYGLYLVDSAQHVDNQVFVDHAEAESTSNQLYKGILDDESRAVFSGKVMVRKDSQKTQAYQNNKNILLTDDAKVFTQPHLEIYADDVKCSHGATVGQLDPNAMFYLHSRGLCEKTARQLLMYAFASEVVNAISIPALKESIDNMVQKRLRGELSICDQCLLHCNDRESPVFDIDLNKI
ncbi:MAG: Fe-S cluster assembly protein SufD [Bacteroidetes bacterium]|nr:Fe-S cluster assembly protein SufD [Bacteroidota bacterium]